VIPHNQTTDSLNLWFGFLNLPFRNGVFVFINGLQNSPIPKHSICSFFSLCLAFDNHTSGKKILTIGHFHTYFSIFEGQIKLVHLCLFLEMKLFGIKFILFSNRRHIIYIWSLACLIIGFNQSITHGRICIHKRLDYSPPSPLKEMLSCMFQTQMEACKWWKGWPYKPQGRKVMGEQTLAL
jgi:hypothetical protein